MEAPIFDELRLVIKTFVQIFIFGAIVLMLYGLAPILGI